MPFTIGLQSNSSNSQVVTEAANVRNVVAETLSSISSTVVDRIPEMIAALIVLLLFWLFAWILRASFSKASRKAKLDVRIKILVDRAIAALVYTIGIFAALSIIFPSFNFSTLLTGLGVTSVVIGIAARDIVNNVISGILILWQRPFLIGDHIFVGSDNGVVEFIGVRATNLRTDNGELVLIPNGTLYTNTVTIRGAGENRRMTFSLCLPYAVDLEKSKAVILDAVRALDNVVNVPAPDVTATEMTAEGIKVNIAFWLDTTEHKPLDVLDDCLSAVHSALRKKDIVPFESAKEDDEPDKPEKPQGKNSSKRPVGEEE